MPGAQRSAASGTGSGVTPRTPGCPASREVGTSPHKRKEGDEPHFVLKVADV
jgi:hypothetical protein